MRAYLRAEANFAGNRYSLLAEVLQQLEYREGVGRLLVVRPAGEVESVVLFIPDELTHSIYAGQHYTFDLRVRETGLLWAEALRKR